MTQKMTKVVLQKIDMKRDASKDRAGVGNLGRERQWHAGE